MEELPGEAGGGRGYRSITEGPGDPEGAMRPVGVVVGCLQKLPATQRQVQARRGGPTQWFTR